MTLSSLIEEDRSTTLRSHSCRRKRACLQAANRTAEINSWHPLTAYHVPPSHWKCRIYNDASKAHDSEQSTSVPHTAERTSAHESDRSMCLWGPQPGFEASLPDIIAVWLTWLYFNSTKNNPNYHNRISRHPRLTAKAELKQAVSNYFLKAPKQRLVWI